MDQTIRDQRTQHIFIPDGIKIVCPGILTIEARSKLPLPRYAQLDVIVQCEPESIETVWRNASAYAPYVSWQPFVRPLPLTKEFTFSITARTDITTAAHFANLVQRVFRALSKNIP